MCLGSSKLPLLPHNHVPRLVFTKPAEPALGSREDTFELFIRLLRTRQTLRSTDSTTVGLDTVEAEGQGPEAGRDAPGGTACLFGAGRRQQTIPHNASRQEPREESRPLLSPRLALST